MNKISKIAKKNKDVAMALIVQAIIDEGAIGADGTITISYTSKENAFYLWDIANTWKLVHPLRKKKYISHTKWIVSFQAEKRKEIYANVGPLPDPMHDKMFRHILRRHKGGSHKGKRGETKREIYENLKNKNMTIREISYALDISSSTVKSHLKKLKEEGRIFIVGVNKDCIKKNQRIAQIWSAT